MEAPEVASRKKKKKKGEREKENYIFAWDSSWEREEEDVWELCILRVQKQYPSDTSK